MKSANEGMKKGYRSTVASDHWVRFSLDAENIRESRDRSMGNLCGHKSLGCLICFSRIFRPITETRGDPSMSIPRSRWAPGWNYVYWKTVKRQSNRSKSQPSKLPPQLAAANFLVADENWHYFTSTEHVVMWGGEKEGGDGRARNSKEFRE